ncbi:MAG: flagellar basal body-associated FliL family protein [Betaproteobacteria bacterium]|nr:flagellar basal body-associated FliL family protein [Betaproteobacteria bacterium]
MAGRVIKKDKGSREVEAEQKLVRLKLILAVAGAEGPVKSHMPEVSNRILPLLPGKTMSQISSAGGKQKLGSETFAPVKQPFAPQPPKRTVSSVFFTSFIIQ